MKRDSGTNKAMSKLFVTARAMSRRFSGMDLHRFVTDILHNSKISDNRLNTARQLRQFALGPGIILDSFAKDQINWTPVYKYLSCWNMTQILESLEVVVSIGDKSMRQVQEEMLKFNWVPPDYFEGKVMEKLFSEERCRRLSQNVCRNFNLPYPAGLGRCLWRTLLDQELEAYGRGEVEDEDFLHSFGVICMESGDMEKEALSRVLGVVKPLGQYLAEMRHPTVLRGDHRPSEKPVCQQPFNVAFHELGRECGETRVIEDEVDVCFFSEEVRTSQHITILGHVPPKLVADSDKIDLLTIKTKKKVFIVLPKVFPQILRSVGEALRKFALEQTIFAHKGNLMRQFCKDTFQWEPTKVIDVFQACRERGWGVKDSLDRIATDVVGGNFCRRGWHFDAVAIPSSTVLEHRKLSASLVHKFGMNLQEEEVGRLGHST
jgi:hypothetical protein